MERPIIFSTEMVKAILDGRKTMTRRVIKPQPVTSDGMIAKSVPIWLYPSEFVQYCPYGQVGDRLWVRETWRVESFMDGEPMLFGYKDGQTMEEDTNLSDTLDYEGWYERVCIQSTEDAAKAFKQGQVRRDDECYHWDLGKSPCRWRPSIFIPRWASRLTLEITGVRAERLQEITEEDALAEGCLPLHCEEENMTEPATIAFEELWDSLNAKRGYGWGKNPWVWVIKFKMPEGR